MRGGRANNNALNLDTLESGSLFIATLITGGSVVQATSDDDPTRSMIVSRILSLSYTHRLLPTFLVSPNAAVERQTCMPRLLFIVRTRDAEVDGGGV